MEFLDVEFFDLDDEIGDVLDRLVKSAGCKNISELKPDSLMKPKIKKEELVGWLDETVDFMKRARQALRVANSVVDDLQKEAIKDKATIISLQNVVIEKQSSQLKEVSQTVQTKMESYCDIVKKSCKQSVVTAENIRTAVKSVNEEEDRSRNLLLFALSEETTEDLPAKVADVLESLGEKPRVLDCARLRINREGSCRPVKVTLSNPGSVSQVLRHRNKLRTVDRYRTTFLAPDRTAEERAAHKTLVEQLKEKIKAEPMKYHYIRGKIIVSTIKRNQSAAMDPLLTAFFVKRGAVINP